MTDYEQRRQDAVLFRLGGVPAKNVAAWLSAIDRAEREGRPCPGWDELERIAPSLPLETTGSMAAAARTIDEAMGG